MRSSALRRPRLCPLFGPDHLNRQDEKLPPEDVVKVGGLPAMLKALREKRSISMTAGSLAAGDDTASCKEPSPVQVKSAIQPHKRGNRLQNYLEASDLEKKIIRQVEHYFGDYNMPKDRFMQEQADPEGWISIDIMLTFRRLKELSLDADLIMEALLKSPNEIVDVDFVGRRIRRHPDNPLPVEDEARKLEVQERTVFVSGFHRERTTLDDLLKFFESGDFGEVCYVRMRFRLNPKEEQSDVREEVESRVFLGSIFVTFKTFSGANYFIKRTKTEEGVKFGSRRLKAKAQREFLERRVENNDEFFPDRVARTVYVQGFDRTDLSDQDLADFFSKFNGAESVRKRVYRDNNSHEEAEGDWKFNGSVFVCFESERAAEAFMRVHRKKPITYFGDKLKVKTQLEYYEYMGKFKRRIREFKEQ